MDGVPSVGTNTFKARANVLVCAMELLASLARAGVAIALVNLGRSGTGQSIRCFGRVLHKVVESLAGDLILGIGGEGAVGGCGARLVSLGMELRCRIVADQDTRLVLLGVSTGPSLLASAWKQAG
jgi:hypothetical protein